MVFIVCVRLLIAPRLRADDAPRAPIDGYAGLRDADEFGEFCLGEFAEDLKRERIEFFNYGERRVGLAWFGCGRWLWVNCVSAIRAVVAWLGWEQPAE